MRIVFSVAVPFKYYLVLSVTVKITAGCIVCGIRICLPVRQNGILGFVKLYIKIAATVRLYCFAFFAADNSHAVAVARAAARVKIVCAVRDPRKLAPVLIYDKARRIFDIGDRRLVSEKPP